MNHRFRQPPNMLLVLVLCIAAAGCATYQSQVIDMSSAWVSDQLPIATQQFCKRAEKEKDSGDAILWNAEAGAAHRALGEFEESNRHLDLAIARVDAYEEQAKVKVGRESMAIMSNQQNLDYEGRSYDKIILHTYKALNYLSLGEPERARPEIIRAYQRQQDAVDENQRRIEKAQEEAAKNNQNQAEVNSARNDKEYSQALGTVEGDLEGFKFYADYVNPFAVYLDALFFKYTGVDASDLERSRKSFARLQELLGDNKFIQADLESFASENRATAAPTTYVIFETGQGATRNQIRIDVPIIVTSVSYVGAAFPRLAFHKNYAANLTVSAGDLLETTVPIANMDAIIGLDFKNEWPTIVTKTTISTVAKGVAADAINRSAKKTHSIIGLVAQIATAVTQAAMNIADTRSWTTLPKEFQIARLPRPADGKLTLTKPGALPVNVELTDGTVTVVYVRSITATDRLMVSQFKLK